LTFSIAKTRSKLETLRDTKPTGKPVQKLAGVWVDELASLGKAITLCRECKRKFNFRAYDYEQRKLCPMWDEVIGECDGCKTGPLWCQLFTKRNCHGI